MKLPQVAAEEEESQVPGLFPNWWLALKLRILAASGAADEGERESIGEGCILRWDLAFYAVNYYSSE